MADLFEVDRSTGFYRSKDPVKNFKICVHLQRVTSASIVSQAVIEKETDDADQREKRIQQSFGQCDEETYTFHWQEKLFCQREFDYYAIEDNCATVLERKYHGDVSNMMSSGRPTKRLFTYVDHDHFTNNEENCMKMTTSPNEEAAKDAESTVRQRKNAKRVRDSQPMFVSKNSVVDYKPVDNSRCVGFREATPAHTMYIMADLSADGNVATEDNEAVLCVISVDVNGVISMNPDFSKMDRPYRVESTGVGRDIFGYKLTHCSQQLSRQEQDKENKMMNELYSKHVEYLASIVGHEMEAPPVDALRTLIYGEIESAQDFEYNDLYIHFFLELPKYWHTIGAQKLSGVTQICRTKVVGRRDVAHFNFPFNFEMMYKNDSLDPEERAKLPEWPVLYLEVLSLDSWERYRTEGYGYTVLPMQPGMHKSSTHCWRPVGRSILSELRRFFIGGSAELEDPAYVAVPTAFQGNQLSKFGLRTQSTGHVNLKFNVIHQSETLLRQAAGRKKVGHVMSHIGSSVSQANIMNVLEAFQQAKLRMIATRDNLKKNYIETLKAYDSDD